MRIVVPEYTFWTEGNDYKILNNGIENEIIYTVSLVENAVETIIINGSVLDTETGTIILTTEGVYKLKLVVGIDLYYYDIRHFPELKDNIITTIKNTLCSCSIEQTCSIPQAVVTEVYKLQLLFSSTNVYRDLLLSPSFIRNYQYTFTTGLDNKNTNLLTLIQDSYNTLSTVGEVSESALTINLYIAYIYILFYIIEMDSLLYETDVDRVDVGFLFEDDDTAEVRALKTVYGFDELISCFEALNIDLHATHLLMYELYIQYPLGLMDMSSWDSITAGDVSLILDDLPKAGLYTTLEDANKPYGIAVFDSKYFKANGGAITLSDELVEFLEADPLELTAENVSYANETYINVQSALDAIIENNSDKNYVHSQGSVSASWNITHNLNKYPSVTVITSQGAEVEGEVIHTDINNVVLNFSAPFSGTAIFN